MKGILMSDARCVWCAESAERNVVAAIYSLQPNEVVILKEERVMHGGALAVYTDQLILTNLNIVLVKKGLFGNAKGVRIFPVGHVKVYNGQAQAVIGKAANGTAVLEVYFLDGQERFSFQSGGKKKLSEWVVRINEVVTGESQQLQPGMAVPGAELVAGVLKDTIGVFTSRLGSKSTAPVKVAGKCTACAAPLAGPQGQTVTCTYCGSTQQLTAG